MNIKLYDNEYYWVKYDPEDEPEIAQYKNNNFYFCGYDAPVHKDKIKIIQHVTSIKNYLKPSWVYDVEKYYLEDDTENE